MSISHLLGEHLVRDREAHDLSRNPEFASFQFLGYRTSPTAVELVAFCDADGMTEGDIVRRRDEFFELVRRLPHDYGLKPRGRNPNGLLGFVFAGGCTEQMARFIARQTRISHAAGTGGVLVSWAIDVPARRIHTHDNPVSIFPPVIVAARSVYPGLDFLESRLGLVGDGEGGGEESREEPKEYAYDVFISYASEDGKVAAAIAQELTNRRLRVWLDRTVLKPGDSLRRSIDHGLANSRFGLVLLSRTFFSKQWPQRELDGMFARETMEGRTHVLPVWHEIDEREILRYSPILADKVALRTSEGIPVIANRVADMFARLTSETPSIPPLEQAAAVVDADAGKRHILYLAANSAAAPLDLEREIKQVETDLRLGKERDRLEFKPVVAATINRVMQAMLDDPPTIVHFSGHGNSDGIVLRNEAGQPHVVSAQALASLFELFRDSVRCVVLNACWSEPQGQAIRRHVPHVVGTRADIGDEAAVAFSAGFYKAIAAGRDVPFAFRLGVARVQAEGGGDEDAFVLL